MQETMVQPLGQEDLLREEMTTHTSILFFFSCRKLNFLELDLFLFFFKYFLLFIYLFYFTILAWRIPWREEPGGLQSMGSQSWTQLSDFTI